MNVLSSILKNDKAVKIIFISGITLIILIFLLDTFGKSTGEAPAEVRSDYSSYERQLETELAEIIGKIAGAGEINVMITLDNNEETVYSEKNDVTTVRTPAVRGAVIVSTGSSDIVVKQKITEAVSKALGITINKICVTH